MWSNSLKSDRKTNTRQKYCYCCKIYMKRSVRRVGLRGDDRWDEAKKVEKKAA